MSSDIRTRESTTTNSDAGRSTSLIEELRSLHVRGLYLQAYERINAYKPLEQWVDTEELIIGGRLAHNLGSSKLGRLMHRVACKQSPNDADAVYFCVLSMLSRRGPLPTLEKMQEIGELTNASSEVTADWYALRADVLAMLRDFQRAEKWLDRAMKLNEDHAWLWVIKTSLLEYQDRNDEALEVARRAFDIRPYYRPATQNLAHRLAQSNKDEEALDLMRDANSRLECGDLRAQQAALLLELERYDEARDLYMDLERYYPYMKYDKHRSEWVTARMADATYYTGDFVNAEQYAKKADSPFYDTLAENLAKVNSGDQLRSNETGNGHRETLPVKFVRQHHMTCAPATLTAISNYWGRDAEHLDVVEKICYDGTPAHSERRWAESQGYITREFKVTFETAKTLIDLDIPFTLTTIDPGSGHLQAVIGYDVYRQSLRIREPGERHYNEFQAEKMLEHYASSGPRGMVLIPEEKADLIEGVQFEESEFYDLFYKVDLALEAHQRDKADDVVKQMRELDDSHRLTLRARGNVANYDGNMTDMLSVTEKLLEKYPEDVNLLVSKLSCLHDLGRREDRVAMLKTLNDDPKCDAVFWLRYASELIDDAREHKNVEYLLKRTIRYRPHDALAYEFLANIRMDGQRQKEAITLHRFAACISERNENHARSYFLAARALNKTDEALKFLQDRVNRFGKKSTFPTRTYCSALEQLDRTEQLFGLVDEACREHPEDADFLLFAGNLYGRVGKFKKGTELLKQAKGKGHQIQWLRSAALHYHYQGKLSEALKCWMQVIHAEPLDSNAHRHAADLIADTKSRDVAIEHLREYCGRFPNSYSLRLTLIEWLRDEDPEAYAKELQSFLEINPNDGWGLREIAFQYLNEGELEEAWKYADRAAEVDPRHPAAIYVRGKICEHGNQLDEAKQHYREALKISIDYEFAMASLVECCRSKEERVKELAFVYNQLRNQVTFGEGLLSYRNYASSLDSRELLKELHEALKARPDLWHAWSALIHQLSNMQRHDEAIKFADKAVRRFPLLPRMWIDRSAAHANKGDIDGEIESLEKAVEINPTWGEPSRLLSDAYHKKGDFKKAREIVETVIKHEPREVRNRGFLANMMWQDEEKEEAISTITKALELEPGYEWGWSALRGWCADIKQPEKVIELTEKLTKSRPKEARSWLLLAESLGERDQIDQAVEALDRAIQLNPSNALAYSQKAYQLTRAARFDEALDACRPSIFGEKLPIELEGRAAWIEGERGNIETAVSKMENVVRRDTDYFWAWNRLAEWYEYLGRDKDYLRASKEMVRVNPSNPISWGYLGDAELRHKNAAEAKSHFVQAVQLSPEYSFASGKLIDLYLEDKQFDEAIDVVDLIAPHIPPSWVLSEKIRIEALREDQTKAFDYLNDLCETEMDDSGAIDSAVESLFHAKWGEKVIHVLEKQVENPNASPHVGYVFVHLSTTLKRWDECEDKLDQLLERDDLWKIATKKFLEEMGNLGQQQRLHSFIKKHRDRLHGDNDLWVSVGNRYNDIGLPKKALDWLGDWKLRDGVDGRAAFVASVSYWDLGKQHDAAETTQYAIEKFEPDSSWINHQTLRAVYQLVYGSPEQCVDAINEINASYLTQYYQIIFQMVVIVLENLSTRGDYSSLCKQLNGLWAEVPEALQNESLMKRLYNLVRWRSAVFHGKTLKALWWKLKAKP